MDTTRSRLEGVRRSLLFLSSLTGSPADRRALKLEADILAEIISNLPE